MILDTNALSAVVDGVTGIAKRLETADQAAIPVIVLGEYIYGIRQSRHRARYERWLSDWLPAYTILNVDQSTAEHYAAIRQTLKTRGRPIPSNDLWIASLTLQYKLPLLSCDAHFDAVPGLKRVGW